MVAVASLLVWTYLASIWGRPQCIVERGGPLATRDPNYQSEGGRMTLPKDAALVQGDRQSLKSTENARRQMRQWGSIKSLPAW